MAGDRLPKLAPLAGQWRPVQVPITCPAGVLTKLVDTDPSRWSLMFASSDGKQSLIGSNGQTAVQEGFILPADGIIRFDYSHHGNWVQQSWFAFPITVQNIITVWTNQIIPPS